MEGRQRAIANSQSTQDQETCRGGLAMRNEKLPERFYRLLYFSPRPEDDERVCIALLVHDSRDTHVEYDRKLEKVHCFAPDYTRETLSFVLQEISGRAKDFALRGRLPEFSPQFSLSAPRTLLRPFDEQVRSVLRRKYLMKLRSPEQKKRERGLGRKIDRFLAERLGLPYNSARRKATADDLFGTEITRELPKDLTPKPVSRALISDLEVCLLDGVDLHVESTEFLVLKVDRVARTFWQYGKIGELLGSSKRKRIVRAALVFDGSGPSVESSLEWRWDYAQHRFGKDAADFVVRAGSFQQEAELRNALRALLPH